MSSDAAEQPNWAKNNVSAWTVHNDQCFYSLPSEAECMVINTSLFWLISDCTWLQLPVLVQARVPVRPPFWRTWIFPRYSGDLFLLFTLQQLHLYGLLYLALSRFNLFFPPTCKAFHYNMRPFHPVMRPFYPHKAPSGRRVWGWSAPAVCSWHWHVMLAVLCCAVSSRT